jgi:hypothetical protein
VTAHRNGSAALASGRPTDSELLARGDADAFAELYRRHCRRLAGHLTRATGDAEVGAATPRRRQPDPDQLDRPAGPRGQRWDRADAAGDRGVTGTPSPRPGRRSGA